MTPRMLALATLLAIYCFMTGALVGVLVERIRYDRRRAAVLAHYNTLAEQLRARIMAIERDVADGATTDR